MAATLVQWIDRQGWFHALVRGLRLRALVAGWLKWRPVMRSYANGTKVEVADLESFYLSDEIFGRETYRPALARAGEVRTVMDLGCNVGFFCCYLRHYFGRADFAGVGIDANPALLARTRRNLDRNGLEKITLRHGLVGGAADSGTQEFHVYPSHLGSSQFLEMEKGRVAKGNWIRIDVPVLRASAVWREAQGDAPIDLLKIDIEGSEGKLLRSDPELFGRAQNIVLEWHRWLVRKEEIFPVLREMGFAFSEKLDAGKNTELWFFSRKASGN